MAATNAADQHIVRSHVTVHVATTVEELQAPQQHDTKGPNCSPTLREGMVEQALEDCGKVRTQQFRGKVVLALLLARRDEHRYARKRTTALGCVSTEIPHCSHLFKLHRPLQCDPLQSPCVLGQVHRGTTHAPADLAEDAVVAKPLRLLIQSGHLAFGIGTARPEGAVVHPESLQEAIDVAEVQHTWCVHLVEHKTLEYLSCYSLHIFVPGGRTGQQQQVRWAHSESINQV
mmetsp:Transcript_64796/g.208672  ORF Transcript_64796/g.208672 Transcript_64796/m.208672 type:complete len:231 (+) Transcript_64796:908-1600(+)